ncbi:hypothetical protein PG993_004889 [Apiospora rasikravindrae]|uniref:Uncharacterized protein n=1 Tax=Apiospora rasikravindrae TaxID=990691 RepID=A0ABR1TE22_9PEZI
MKQNDSGLSQRKQGADRQPQERVTYRFHPPMPDGGAASTEREGWRLDPACQRACQLMRSVAQRYCRQAFTVQNGGRWAASVLALRKIHGRLGKVPARPPNQPSTSGPVTERNQSPRLAQSTCARTNQSKLPVLLPFCPALLCSAVLPQASNFQLAQAHLELATL